MEKWMIASDIHGSALYCRKLLELLEASHASRLLLLGDLLYHGPRNDLPAEYDPKAVAAMLNRCRSRLLCVRGNCDAEVDQMVLEFPILAEYAAFPVGDRLLYAAHGHHCGEDTPPPLMNGDLLLCGHTHIPKVVEKQGYTYLNPGSVALPKEGSRHSCLFLQDGVFTWVDVETGGAYQTYRLTR